MQQDVRLEFLQVSCYCLDGVPGVLVYDPVPVLASPLWEVSAAQLCLSAVCGALVDLFHKTKHDDIKIVCHYCARDVVDYIYKSMSLLHQAFVFVVQSFAHHSFIFIQSPHFMSICASYRNLFLSVILMHCVLFEDPYVLSYLAFLCVLRNMFLKHDFLAQVASFFTAPRIPLLWLFLAVKLLLFCQNPFRITSIQCSFSCFTSVGSQQSVPPFDVDTSSSYN